MVGLGYLKVMGASIIYFNDSKKMKQREFPLASFFKFYSVLIASRADKLIARFAG